MRKGFIIKLGLIDYEKAYSLQRRLVERRYEDEIYDTLILCEHPHVFTIGRSGRRANILISNGMVKAKGIKVYEIDRGGDITYHGPGQIVGYPILNLNDYKRDIHLMLRNLEEVLIRLLSDYGVKPSRLDGFTGVWVGEEKIASIGIGVRRWITYHGFCLNVDPELEYFSYINPCGFQDKGVTSLKKLKGKIDRERLEGGLMKHFGDVFGLKMEEESILSA